MREPEETLRDLVIAFWHPDYRDERPIEVLRELRQKRQAREVDA